LYGKHFFLNYRVIALEKSGKTVFQAAHLLPSHCRLVFKLFSLARYFYNALGTFAPKFLALRKVCLLKNKSAVGCHVA